MEMKSKSSLRQFEENRPELSELNPSRWSFSQKLCGWIKCRRVLCCVEGAIASPPFFGFQHKRITSVFENALKYMIHSHSYFHNVYLGMKGLCGREMKKEGKRTMAWWTAQKIKCHPSNHVDLSPFLFSFVPVAVFWRWKLFLNTTMLSQNICPLNTGSSDGKQKNKASNYVSGALNKFNDAIHVFFIHNFTQSTSASERYFGDWMDSALSLSFYLVDGGGISPLIAKIFSL